MKFNGLKAELKRTGFDTLRMDRDNYFEAVILKDELTELTQRLENFFSLAV